MKVIPGGIVHLSLIGAGGSLALILGGVLTFSFVPITGTLFGPTAAEVVSVLAILASLLSCGVGLWAGHRLAMRFRNTDEIQSAIRNGYLEAHTSQTELIGHLAFIGAWFACPIAFAMMETAPVEDQSFLCLLGPSLGLIFYRALSPTRLLKKGPQLVIDENGITNSRWHHQFVPWTDIQRIKHERGFRSSRLVVILAENPHFYPQGLLARYSTWSRNGLNLSVGGLDKSQTEIWHFLCSFPKSSELIYGKAGASNQGPDGTPVESGYFRISPELSKEMAHYEVGHKVVWSRQKFANGAYWGTKAIVLDITEKRIKIEFSKTGRLKTRYVKANNLVPRQFVLWQDRGW